MVPTAAVAVTVGNAFTLTVTVAVFTQLLASVPVTVYDVVVVGDAVTDEPDKLPGFHT
jgi:Sec-independent protein secretion pathway component TatC